ncbi:MAG TPA: hypothetical protein VE111_22585 [Bradyrhizobium sp.]|nr:hypothetical protein [Bradyrhizobium sp.]
MSLHQFPRLSVSIFNPDRLSRQKALLAATAMSILVCSGARAADGDANEALLKKLEMMEQRIQSLEAELKKKQTSAPEKQTAPADKPTASSEKMPKKAPAPDPKKNANAVVQADPPQDSRGKPSPKTKPLDVSRQPSDLPILGLAPSPVAGLSIGAYGEIKFGAMQNPAANGRWQNGFDAARFVLLPTYAITDNIIFNAEIEFEHAGSGFDADDKLHGTAEIEQIWIDFKIVDQFNWRSPGIDLVPIGYINQHHEPTQFYSVNRPELYNGLIPSTFFAGASSVYGRIADGLSYQFQISTSIEDFGGDFGLRTAGNAVPAFPAGYMAGIDGLNALGFSRPVRGGFAQLSDTLAYAGKLDFAPPSLPGFAGSISGYFSPDITPRGAYADTGALLGRNSVGIFDAEFRYRVPETGLELRGEYVRVDFSHPEDLRANNDTDPTNNVGKSMFGVSGEIAYHVPLGTILKSDWEAVPFYRYTYENLQTGGFAGTDTNMPTGAGQRQFHTAGFAIFPSPKVVLKATYQRVIDRSIAGALSDSFLGGVGFFF